MLCDFLRHRLLRRCSSINNGAFFRYWRLRRRFRIRCGIFRHYGCVLRSVRRRPFGRFLRREVNDHAVKFLPRCIMQPVKSTFDIILILADVRGRHSHIVIVLLSHNPPGEITPLLGAILAA